jgi:hypothetical protein
MGQMDLIGIYRFMQGHFLESLRVPKSSTLQRPHLMKAIFKI